MLIYTYHLTNTHRSKMAAPNLNINAWTILSSLQKD